MKLAPPKTQLGAGNFVLIRHVQKFWAGVRNTEQNIFKHGCQRHRSVKGKCRGAATALEYVNRSVSEWVIATQSQVEQYKK